MIIVSEKREPYTRHMLKVAKQSSRIGFWFTLLCLPVLLTVIVVSSIYYGAVLHRDQFAGNYEFNLHNLLSSWYMVPYNTLRAQFQDSKNLQIDLKHTDLQKLAYLRQRAFQEGFILDEFKQESVDAEISDGETSVKASIGLTGWFLDHLNTDKWSLRVRVRGDNAIFGMKKFNLLHPVTRQGIYEWIAHQFEKYEGLASLPYDFVDVTINGKNNGIYAIESSFDKYVMDKNKLREGFLFRIHPQFEVFEYDDVALNPVQRERIAYLKNIWGEFLAGKRTVAEVFDIEKLAKFYAICDLVNGDHALAAVNLFYYFNPITLRAEPVGREWLSKPYRPLVSLAGELLGPNITVSFHKIIFKDSLFYKTYIENLTRISQSRYLSEFWESIAGKLRQEMNILHKSYPYYAVSDEYLKQNQEVIRNVLARQDLLLATVRLVDSAFVEIEAENASKFPLEIVSLSVNGIDNFKSAKEKVLAPRWEGDEARREKIRFLAPTSDLFDGELQHAEVHYRILGNPDTVNSTSVSIEKDQSPSPLLPINMKGNLDEFDFVKPIKDSTQVRISKGSWTITKDLVVPADTPLLIEAGASLDLQNNALILSKAPLTIRGSKDSPVKIYSSDNTGQGVVVTSVASTSVVENTNFSGLSYPHRPGWELTGSVTFYESPVEISDSSFALNHSEDAINIVRTHFSLVNVLFDRTAGDAFDADFTRGLIANSRFVNLGNDAIDVSGSDVELSNIVIENPGDKGVSVGENSRVRAVGISVAGGKVGVASKDLSNLVGEDFVVDGSEIGFAAFQKKPNFGPSSISLKNLKLKSSKTLFLIEKNSKMSVDGKRIPDSAEKVRDQLYGE